MDCGIRYKPDDETRAKVSALKSFGHTHEEIALFLDMSDDTLKKYYKNELDTAVINANYNVANKLYKKAVDDEDLSAQIFWLKTRARWRTQDVESLHEQNDKMRSELKELRSELDAKNKQEY